jgi:hypothetical protein
LAPPVGSDPLWYSVAEQTSANVLVGTWSTPVRLDGAAGAPGTPGRDAIIFRQESAPGSGMITNDVWYKPSTKQFFQWTGSSWQAMNGAVASLDLVTASFIAVSSLSSLTATIGLLRTAATGARVELADNQIRVYDSANVLRIRMGVW